VAFTNPILAGEQLNSTGIRSDNYNPGVSGWRIATNGAAEFDNVGIRGNLWIPTITLNGRDLGTTLNTLPKGVMAWYAGYPAVATTSAAKLISTEVDVVNGRWYEISLINITPDIANTKACEFHIKYTTDGSTPAPDGSGTTQTFAISLRLSQFEMGNVRAMWGANFTGRLKLIGTIHSLDGQNVRSWAPGNGCVLAVYDMGITPGAFGSIGASAPTKTLKEWTITANDTRSYHQNGTDLGGTFGRDMVQGTALSSTDHCRSYAVFSAADRALIADVQGVPLSDILVCEWWVHVYFWYQGTGWLLMGHHNVTSVGTSEPGGSTLNSDQFFLAGQVGNWLGMLGGTSQTFVNALQAGTAKGLVLGAASGNERQYGGVANGAFSSDPPKLHLKYYK